jgi:hypothetical protein
MAAVTVRDIYVIAAIGIGSVSTVVGVIGWIVWKLIF